MEKIVGPLSTGSLRLASTDVRVNPIVRFNYFSNPVDVERCMNGTRKIGDVLRSRSMEDFMFREWFGVQNFRFVGPALPVDQSNFLNKWLSFVAGLSAPYGITVGDVLWGRWLIVITA